jgi:hypothetical protein
MVYAIKNITYKKNRGGTKYTLAGTCKNQPRIQETLSIQLLTMSKSPIVNYALPF